MKIDEYMKSTEKPVDLCKEIDELRAENQMLRNQNNMLTCFCDDCKKIEKLQKENAELNRDKTELENQLKNNSYVQILQNEKAELAEDFVKQIEKMKCCGNCKNKIDMPALRIKKRIGLIYQYSCKIKCICISNKCDKWEVAE